MSHARRLLVITLALIGLIGLGALPVHAADAVMTLAPGAKATIALDLWCLDYGKAFPTSIQGPTGRPPDQVVKVMQTAITKGTVTSDVYQTQVAIWRATTGAFQDPGGKGTVLAEQIWNDAQSVTIAALPTDAVLLGDAVKAGTLKVTITNFLSLPVQGVPGDAFHGKADLVVENVSAQPVRFVLVEGSLFEPVGGVGQTLISHQAPVKPAVLPDTGYRGVTPEVTIAVTGAGGLLLLAGRAVRRRAAR